MLGGTAMKLIKTPWLLRLVLVSILVSPLRAAEAPPKFPIARFSMVDERGIYRGGQPDRAGFAFLKEKGIKTVINLRTENDEAELVSKLGMRYEWLPMSIKPWSGIPDPAIDKFFAILSNPENYPIYFHCRRGADRTGALAAFYRISVQGWDSRKAYSEARQIGMRWWYPALKKQIHQFEQKALVPVKSTRSAEAF